MKSKMKAIQVSAPGAEFKLMEIDVPEPKENEVLIKVEACGVCHGDALVKEGHFPGLSYPRIPGHEVVGRIEVLTDIPPTGFQAKRFQKTN
jgi:propanol-preferring alcohol dehydrogenase